MTKRVFSKKRASWCTYADMCVRMYVMRVVFNACECVEK